MKAFRTLWLLVLGLAAVILGLGRHIVADLFGIHLFPTLQVFVGMLPVYIACTRPGDGVLWLAWLAFVIG